jgi:enoyl-CoA hydratase/carnithine racemase
MSAAQGDAAKADAVTCELEASVAYITLSAPASGNLLTSSLLEGLQRAFAQATGEATCRAIVLSAEGKQFCGGLDLGAAFASGGDLDPAFVALSLDCLSRIRRAGVPVIACVEGDVTGGGVGLVAACDIVIASPQSVFMLSEVIVGLIPALIAPFLLRRLTPARLGYMAQSSRGIRGIEAREWGLVDELAEESVAAALHRQLQRILRSSPGALAESKAYFDALTAKDLARQTGVAGERLLGWLSRPEVVEGARAFAEGGVPPWFKKHVARR